MHQQKIGTVCLGSLGESWLLVSRTSRRLGHRRISGGRFWPRSSEAQRGSRPSVLAGPLGAACARPRTVALAPYRSERCIHPLRGAAIDVARRGKCLTVRDGLDERWGRPCLRETQPYCYGLHSPETRHLAVPGAGAHSGYPYRTCGSRSRHRPCGSKRKRLALKKAKQEDAEREKNRKNVQLFFPQESLLVRPLLTTSSAHTGGACRSWLEAYE